ncbi:MAG: AAA family ATPase [Ginsengibacter sp.]
MKNFIKQIHITNFKSIKDCEIESCRRINLFIGRPNVGKTNIIKALSIFSIPYLRENPSKKLSNLIRLENEGELFHNGDTTLDATIKANIGKCVLGYNPKDGLRAEVDFIGDSYNSLKIDENLTVKGIYNHQYFEPPVKRYNFKTNVIFKKSHAKYLIPPYGFNLFSIIENYPDLKREVAYLFKEYGLEIVFEKGSQ